MKNFRFLYTAIPFLLGAFCFTACDTDIKDIDKVQESLELSASSTSIALDGENLQGDIITFDWTESRKMPDDYFVSYETKLDVVGNNFGASTAIFNYEDEGVFSRSFTSEQLQNWANEKWKLPSNKPFILEFRVVAQYEGGHTFEMPEVRTVSIDVQPIRTIVFDADKIFLKGSAVPGMSGVEMSKTLENENLYASILNLEAGELLIPVEFEGETNYICPVSGNGDLQDGESVKITMQEEPMPWKIPTAGEYRIVVNMEKATVAIYSPEKALKPKSVMWNSDKGEVTTEITDLWLHGAINGWGNPIKGECTVSLADPQVLIYRGGKTGKAKFIVYGGADNDKNLAYAFSCEPKSESDGQELSLTLGKQSDLFGGYSRGQRNSYYAIPTGANFVILDLRNMTIRAEKREE